MNGRHFTTQALHAEACHSVADIAKLGSAIVYNIAQVITYPDVTFGADQLIILPFLVCGHPHGWLWPGRGSPAPPRPPCHQSVSMVKDNLLVVVQNVFAGLALHMYTLSLIGACEMTFGWLKWAARNGKLPVGDRCRCPDCLGQRSLTHIIHRPLSLCKSRIQCSMLLPIRHLRLTDWPSYYMMTRRRQLFISCVAENARYVS